MRAFRQGCLTLLATGLILFTAAFGTGAAYFSFHDTHGHARRPGLGSFLLLLIVIAVPLAGGVYMLWLDWLAPRSDHRPHRF